MKQKATPRPQSRKPLDVRSALYGLAPRPGVRRPVSGERAA